MADEIIHANTGDTVPQSPPTLLSQLSPELVHANLLGCHALKNRVDLRLLEWLFVLIEKKFSPALGYPGPLPYVMVHLHYQKSEAYCVLLAAKVLPFLPHTARAYGRGDLSWSQVKQLVRVRKAMESMKEEEWIAFARTHNVAALKAEVRDALKEGRDHPRKGTYGLPNTHMRLSFHLLRDAYELARKALEAKAQAMRAKRGKEDWRPTPEEVILEVFEESLAKDLEALEGDEGKEKRLRSLFEVLYRICPQCKAGHVHTEEGLVEVSPERLALIEKVARRREIQLDEELARGVALSVEAGREIPEEVRAAVLANHNHACAHCGRRLDLHVHHLVEWSQGGPHEAWNLIPCCRRCHANVHHGTLEVYRDSTGELHWRSRADRLAKVYAGEIEELASIPSVSVVRVEATPEAVAAVVPPAPAGGVLEALMKIGHKRHEAQALIWKARVDLRDIGRAPTEEELLNSAVYGRAMVSGGAVRSGRAENRKNGGEKASEARRDGGEAPSKGSEGGVGGV